MNQYIQEKQDEFSRTIVFFKKELTKENFVLKI